MAYITASRALLQLLEGKQLPSKSPIGTSSEVIKDELEEESNNSSEGGGMFSPRNTNNSNSLSSHLRRYVIA